MSFTRTEQKTNQSFLRLNSRLKIPQIKGSKQQNVELAEGNHLEPTWLCKSRDESSTKQMNGATRSGMQFAFSVRFAVSSTI